jgi:hypothetical protein
MENKGLLISSSENSGIYFWNFLGDTTFTESEIIQELEKLNNPSNVKKLVEKPLVQDNTSVVMGKSIMSNKNVKGKEKKGLMTKDIRTKHMEKEYKAENDFEKSNPNYEIIKKGIKEQDPNDDNKENIYDLKVLPLNEYNKNDEISINYTNTDFQIKEDDLNKYDYSNIAPDDPKNQEINNKILFKSKYLPEKIKNYIEPEIRSKTLKCKYCLGLSVNSMNNIVFNKRDKWYAYTINNKIIVEFLEKERREVILSDSKDELSCLIMSPDGNNLISGVGCTNMEEYAPIFVYEIVMKNYTLTRRTVTA